MPIVALPYCPPSLSLSQAQSEYREGDPEWCSDDQVSHETQAKVLGIRLLSSWLVGLESDFEHFSSPVFRLLDMILAHDGDLQGEDNIRQELSQNHESWIQCLLLLLL